ncbi:MAG: DNA cytosine methyltransferase [Chloroflexi bacterium]|nr:DNA cytosine methyltransferase [Chloroflexota bacterium]PWB43760.1 MAG: DNA (cytosine-5-)-methyltransferase [Dehalococcoidia bacterium]
MGNLSVVDLFAGAGGLSVGFRDAGFSILAANDFDENASETFMLNHPETAFLSGPIQRIGAEDFLCAAELRRGELDVLIGGPPCQAFSVYNHQRGMHDERSGLFREYTRLVDGLMPRFVVMENVTGITSIENGQAVEEIHLRLKELGYAVEARILKAEEYGVPQERRRIFFIGVRDGQAITWPETTHGAGDSLFTLQLRPLVTVADAISDLPALGMGEGAEEMAYTAQPQSAYQERLRRGSRCVYNHIAPMLADVNRERMKYIPVGGSWRDLPFNLLPTGMKAARRSDHTKRYGRMDPTGQSCTILTKCDLHWGAYIHPFQDRTITVREAARLQSFPDTFRFAGSRGEQYRQVGNAVPPTLARAVADAVLNMMGQSDEKHEGQLVGAAASA